YTTPSDPEGFEKHYLEVHAPLVADVPGLQDFTAGRFVAAMDGGELSYYRIAELSFADQAALEAGLGSEQGQKTAGDYQQIAPPGSRMFVVAVD
ncbi:MAG: hypothetical protein QOC80_3019, partial [Frankiaceae bacterium]|nr:hypothetical protein [Frankiaceae bacterium]